VRLLELPLKKIVADPRCQARVLIDAATVEEYADAMAAGSVFPPGVVFWDGSVYWLGDGFTRRAACEQRGIRHMRVEVKEGGLRDAILYAVGANSLHGKRPTLEDRRKAIGLLLDDAEWSRWSDSEIARRCGVDRATVKGQRILRDSAGCAPAVRAQRGGTEYTMRLPERLEDAEPEEQVRRIQAAEARRVCPTCGGTGEVEGD
jgi:hypothetical protein